MRGISSMPFVAFLGTLAILITFGGGAATQGTGEGGADFGLYAPQSAPADQPVELTTEELHPVAPAPRILQTRPERRISQISRRRAKAAFTLLFASQLNTPHFRASLGSISQGGASFGILPGVAIASASRIQGVVPARRHLARRGTPESVLRGRDETHAALSLHEGLL